LREKTLPDRPNPHAPHCPQQITGLRRGSLGLERLSNEAAFYKIFPAKIAQGEKQSVTWRWILSRIRDGNGVVAPRNLVDFMENCREAQLRSELRNPREYADGISLIEADAVRKAHRTLSSTRVQDTLIAESKELAPYIERFRKNKAEHNLDSLCTLLRVPSVEGEALAKSLIEIGFLEEAGNSYKVPLLYRDGLGITQGKAFEDSGAVSTSSDLNGDTE